MFFLEKGPDTFYFHIRENGLNLENGLQAVLSLPGRRPSKPPSRRAAPRRNTNTSRPTNNAARQNRGNQAAQRQNCNSFVPDAQVMLADGATKAIDQIEVGDWVWAKNPDTGERGPRQVTDLIKGHGEKKLVEIHVAGENGHVLTATDEHPFYVTDVGWVVAEDLQHGDKLVSDDGHAVAVDHVHTHMAASQAVFNLTVDDLHTYYVLAGNQPVLVHNCPDGGGGTPRSRQVPDEINHRPQSSPPRHVPDEINHGRPPGNRPNETRVPRKDAETGMTRQERMYWNSLNTDNALDYVPPPH